MSDSLDPRTVPLWGTRLVEASAGTGKTWTIAALYLRFVLGHGRHAGDADDTAFGRPLAPREILVMTFTIAATRELSARIRDRLVEAARCFRGDPGAPAPDDFLADLLDDHPAGPARVAAAHRLATAAGAMDDAAVFTIDAWCQRMLREHAFDSGSAFEETLEPDDRPMRSAAVRDYWRAQVYPLTGPAYDAVLRVWSSVDALDDDMGRLLTFDDDDPPDPRALDALLAPHVDAVQATVEVLRPAWVVKARAMRAWLEPLMDEEAFSKTKAKTETVIGWLDALDAWAAAPVAAIPELGKGLDRLTRDGITDAFKKGRGVPVPDVFDDFTTLADAIRALPDPRAALRRHAMTRVTARMRELKTRAAAWGFQDMLVRLERALDGPQGPMLRQRIVSQYPAALIDEFQDTNALQYRIFDKLYDVDGEGRDTALFLIGDPKQSIYAFRGADIASYLRAGDAAGANRYPLATNHRSTVACVDAVNRLFVGAEARDGEGAFRYRTVDATGTVVDRLPFAATRAKGRADRLEDRHGPLPAMTLVHDPALAARDVAHAAMAARAAEHLVGLLDDPDTGFVEEGRRRRLRAGDVAVLVRTGAEADEIRHALQARGIPSVYLSDGDSAFATDEAADVLHWLRAVDDPADARLARIALATASLGRPLAALAALNADDAALERELETLRAMNAIWRRQGVMPMLRAFLHRQGLPSRWLAGEAGGERRLTNVLHLAELLQSASAEVEGEQALIRWFADRRAAAAWPAEEQIVRLESDADLVQVVTVHKAKGLEYPVVVIPFGTTAMDARKPDFVAVERDGRRTVDFTVDAEAHERARLAQRQEEVRLLYVALTRARHALWIGVPAERVKKNSDLCTFGRSALGHLVGATENTPASRIEPLLRATFDGLPQVRIEIVDGDVPVTPLAPREDRPALVAAPVYRGVFERDWTIGSFSALVRDLEHGEPDAKTAPALVDPAMEEELRTTPAEPDVPVASTAARHRFPRGAFVGNLLHGHLEWLAAHRFALAKDPALRESLVERAGRQGWGGRRGDELATWLGEVVATPLPPVGVALDGLHRTLPEMEFWFPSEGLDVAAVDALCRAHLLDGRDRPKLRAETLTGMLMGFVDLTFAHDGQYWLLDYKSNALGTADGDYDDEALAEAMAVHRYDVQAAIYLLALHRLLRVRLGARYDPALHLGGGIYLFLRGVRGPASGCHRVAAPIALLNGLDALVGSVARVAA